MAQETILGPSSYPDLTKILVIPPKGFWAKVKNVFTKPIFGLFIKESDMPMDPITAIFSFLSTPVGQQLIQPLTVLEAQFNQIILDLIKNIHSKVTTPAPPKQ